MPNIELTRKKDLSLFRRIAIGTWRTPSEAQVYGTLELRMEKACAYLDSWRRATGQRLTITHLVARAAAQAMREMPDANAMMRFSRVYLRKNVDLFLQVALPNEDTGKIDLTGVTIRDADQKSLSEISEETERRVSMARKGEDKELAKTRGSFKRIPLFVVGLFLRMVSFLTYTLNLRIPGMPRDPFGSLMITNVGSIGIDTAYVPLVPYSKVPLILAVGAVKDVPVVDSGRVVPGKVMKVNVTFDHRFIDGFHASVMSRTLTAWFSEPERYFGELPVKLAA